MLERAYLPLKAVHLVALALSVSLFLWRGALRLAGSTQLGSKFLRIAPHAVDTLLLASGILLCVAIRQYPFVAGWLTAKVLALVVYVGLGKFALREARPRAARAALLLAALAVLGYIIATALHHDPDPRRW